MKKSIRWGIGSIIASILVFTFFVNTSLASTNEFISSYDVDVLIETTGEVRVIEYIIYNFGDGQRRGIIRDIPRKYTFEGKTFHMDVDVVTITDEQGRERPFEITEEDFTSIKIGDPSVYISGVQVYKIMYDVYPVVDHFDQYDELYWNLIGTDWNVPIQKAKGTIYFPGEVTESEEICFTGVFGSEASDCHVTQKNNLSVVFETTKPLAPYEGFTVATRFDAGFVPKTYIVDIDSNPYNARIAIDGNDIVDTTPTITRLKEGSYTFTFSKLFYQSQEVDVVIDGLTERKEIEVVLKKSVWGYIGSVWGPWIITLLVVLLSYRYWYRHGKDPKGKGAVIAQYEAPDNITPSQAGFMVDGKVHVHDLSSALLFLAVHEYITITKKVVSEKKFLRKEVIGFVLEKRKEPQVGVDGMTSFEVLLYEKIFNTKQTVTLADLKNSFYIHLPDLRKQLLRSLVTKGYYERDPVAMLNSWIGRALLYFFAMFVPSLILTGIFETSSYIILHILVSIYLYILALQMSAPTKKGAEIKEEVLGLKKFIEVTDAERIKKMYSPETYQNVFHAMLPYAVVFGLEKQWAAHFEELFKEVPDAIRNSSGSSLNDITQNISIFNTALISSMTSAPAQSSGSSGWSGSSGFSGGSSGGGSGGGGGSSW